MTEEQCRLCQLINNDHSQDIKHLNKFMLNKKQTSYKIKKRFQEQFADPSQLSVTPDRTSRPLRRQSPQTNCNSPSSVFGMDAQSDPTQYQQNF
ncbi:hypothetical protein L916_19750 [Phytophthora nicotianae]|uniref:Uncharacterized protein n=1 Tax=Phytophthora nicotianae TaxID=4792 RepID=W2HXD5_PHYNI|nr:hypothetical protein L916_19750 [Phytophthora nicotianae]